MKIPIKLALILTLSFGFSVRGMAQSAGQTVQQAGNCSVNLIGNGAANVSCTRVVDATLADPIQTILKIAKRNENADKDNGWPSVPRLATNLSELISLALFAISSAVGLGSGSHAYQPPVLPAHFTSRSKLLL